MIRLDKATKEYLSAVTCFWLMLYLTVGSLTCAFGVLGTYQQFFFGTALFGLALGFFSKPPTESTNKADSGLLRYGLYLSSLLFLVLVIYLVGYPNGFNTALESVLSDNSIGLYKSVFLEKEIFRQFAVPLFMMQLLLVFGGAAFSAGQWFKERTGSGGSPHWHLTGAAIAWIVASSLDRIPPGLIWLAVLTAVNIYVLYNKQKLAYLCIAIILLSTGTASFIPFMGIQGLFASDFSSISTIASSFAQRIDHVPMLISKGGIGGSISYLNHRFEGIALSEDLSDADFASMKESYEGMKPFNKDDFRLPYLLTEDPANKRLLIIGPQPTGALVAAIKYGFKDITVVSRRASDMILPTSEASQIKTIHSDGFRYLRNCGEKFDVINFTGRFDRQFINPYSTASFDDSLYTKESFKKSATLLNRTGYICVPYLFEFLPLNKTARTVEEGAGKFIAHFRALTGGYILASSEGSSLDTARMLTDLKSRLGTDVVLDVEALKEKQQIRYKSPFSLDFPYLLSPMPLLDMGHLAVLTILMVLVVYSFRLVKSEGAMAAIFSERENLSLFLASAAFMLLASKVATLGCLRGDASSTPAAFYQALPWLGLLIVLVLPLSARTIAAKILKAPLACVLIFVFVILADALKNDLVLALGAEMVAVMILAMRVNLQIEELCNSNKKIEAVVAWTLGLAAGFVLTYSSIYGGVGLLDQVGLGLVLMAVLAVYIRRRPDAI